MSKKNIFIIGHRGMLGSFVTRYFEDQGYEVLTTDCRYSGGINDPLIRDVVNSQAEYVVNAGGLIRQKSTDQLMHYLLNAILPMHLIQSMRSDQKLIHPSTDCVFSGKTGWYDQSDPHDPSDVYGLSKSFGEKVSSDPRTVVIRTSLVGPEQGTKSGLLAWFLEQDEAVNGYTDHFWNGLTTLEWAKMIFEIVSGERPFPQGLMQVGTEEGISKYNLLMLFKEIWGLNIDVKPCDSGHLVNRTLKPMLIRKPIRDQLEELKAFSDKITV
jgi:dTDP-4-dehydrorhamnose reductase